MTLTTGINLPKKLNKLANKTVRQKTSYWPGQKAQWFKAVTALAEDRRSVLAPTLPLTPVTEDLTPSFGIHRHLHIRRHTHE